MWACSLGKVKEFLRVEKKDELHRTDMVNFAHLLESIKFHNSLHNGQVDEAAPNIPEHYEVALLLIEYGVDINKVDKVNCHAIEFFTFSTIISLDASNSTKLGCIFWSF